MKIIEHNPTYELTEVAGRFGPEVGIHRTALNYKDIQLTPHGAYTLGKQLINWAASVDPELVAIG